MTTNESGLAVFGEAGALAPSKYSDDAFKATTSGGGFLARLQLMTSNSEKCKSGEFPINHYALVDGSALVDLGSEVDVVVVSWRPKAIDMSGDDIITVYDPKVDSDGVSTGEFGRIEAKSFETNSNCMFGHEYLVYIPEKKVFATVFFGSKSARRESPSMKAQMHKVATLKADKIETKSFTWFAMKVFSCTTPVSEMPSLEVIKKEIDKFENPEVEEVKRVDAEAPKRAQ